MQSVTTLGAGRIWLAVNGKTRQEADLSQLIWSVREVITILSQSMRLEPGDLVMTGTPAGVGAVVPGDMITGGIDGLAEITTPIGPAI
jgi:fumarylpyruvate hydrolase